MGGFPADRGWEGEKDVRNLILLKSRPEGLVDVLAAAGTATAFGSGGGGIVEDGGGCDDEGVVEVAMERSSRAFCWRECRSADLRQAAGRRTAAWAIMSFCRRCW